MVACGVPPCHTIGWDQSSLLNDECALPRMGRSTTEPPPWGGRVLSLQCGSPSSDKSAYAYPELQKYSFWIVVHAPFHTCQPFTCWKTTNNRCKRHTYSRKINLLDPVKYMSFLIIQSWVFFNFCWSSYNPYLESNSPTPRVTSSRATLVCSPAARATRTWVCSPTPQSAGPRRSGPATPIQRFRSLQKQGKNLGKNK